MDRAQIEARFGSSSRIHSMFVNCKPDDGTTTNMIHLALSARDLGRSSALRVE